MALEQLGNKRVMAGVAEENANNIEQLWLILHYIYQEYCPVS